MDTISNNTSQIAAVRTITSLNFIKKTYNIPQNVIKSFANQISDATKNSLVTEPQNNYANPATYNFQYQPNVPVSLLSTADQPYAYTEKSLANSESSSLNDESENSDYYVEESNEKKKHTNLGYYLIDNSLGTSSSGKSTQKASNPMRDRLNKVYNLNFSIEPGTIVNVTCV
jgi:uncharacterized protein YkwD